MAKMVKIKCYNIRYKTSKPIYLPFSMTLEVAIGGGPDGLEKRLAEGIKKKTGYAPSTFDYHS